MFGIDNWSKSDATKIGESIGHILNDRNNNNTRPKKRARTDAYELPPDPSGTVVDCAIGVLPNEMLQAIVGCLAPRDLPAVAASGAPLSNAARAALDRRLLQALAVTGVEDADDDPLGALVVLHNAITRDDPVTTKAILDAGLADSINEPLPAIKNMPEWDTPIVAAFYLDNDGTMERSASTPWDGDGKHGYDMAFDVSTSTSSTLRSWRILPHTPLVRAIQCGARRCVRVLLAAGARPCPSPEALLGCALDRIFHTHVAIAEYHSHIHDDYWRSHHAWVPRPHRATDRVGIVEDLVATFARTPPPLPMFDINPLSALRYGTLFSCRKGHGTAGTDLERVLGAVLGAGYSPDERMSRLPPLWAVMGTPEERTETQARDTWTRLAGPDSRPWTPRDSFAKRRETDMDTEREAAAIMCVQWIRESGGNAKSMLIPMAILAMYGRLVPRDVALVEPRASTAETVDCGATPCPDGK